MPRTARPHHFHSFLLLDDGYGMQDTTRAVGDSLALGIYQHSRLCGRNVSFGTNDVRVIQQYYGAHPVSLPPGLQKKLARGKPLPPGWQKKLQPFPSDVDVRLVPPCGYCGRGVIRPAEYQHSLPPLSVAPRAPLRGALVASMTLATSCSLTGAPLR